VTIYLCPDCEMSFEDDAEQDGYHGDLVRVLCPDCERVSEAVDLFLSPMPMVVVDDEGMRVETVDIHAETRAELAERRAERRGET
jgi:glutaredoxin